MNTADALRSLELWEQGDTTTFLIAGSSHYMRTMTGLIHRV